MKLVNFSSGKLYLLSIFRFIGCILNKMVTPRKIKFPIKLDELLRLALPEKRLKKKWPKHV